MLRIADEGTHLPTHTGKKYAPKKFFLESIYWNNYHQGPRHQLRFSQPIQEILQRIMMLWNSFDEVGLEDRFTEKHQRETCHCVQMLEKGNTNIALIACHHNDYRHLLSTIVGGIGSKQTK